MPDGREEWRACVRGVTCEGEEGGEAVDEAGSKGKEWEGKQSESCGSTDDLKNGKEKLTLARIPPDQSASGASSR